MLKTYVEKKMDARRIHWRKKHLNICSSEATIAINLNAAVRNEVDAVGIG